MFGRGCPARFELDGKASNLGIEIAASVVLLVIQRLPRLAVAEGADSYLKLSEEPPRGHIVDGTSQAHHVRATALNKDLHTLDEMEVPHAHKILGRAHELAQS